MGGNNELFENFERNKYLKKLPSMQRDNYQIADTVPSKSLEQNKIFSHHFKKCVYLKCPLQTIHSTKFLIGHFLPLYFFT